MTPDATIAQASPHGNGHIHRSYRLINAHSEAPDFLLQEINQQVFPDIPQLMDNIQNVTAYLHKYGAEDGQRNLQLVPTINRDSFYQDTQGRYWRMYIFEKDLYSIEIPEQDEQIYQAAKAFGYFFKDLKDYPLSTLHAVIPDFHNLSKRLATLQLAKQVDSYTRLKEIRPEIKKVAQYADQLLHLQRLVDQKVLPNRVTHNDTKVNNVLFDRQGIARCVVDLDTVMPGLVHYDFGDGIRTTVSTTAEDEVDLQKIEPDMERFAAFAEGYLDACADMLTADERTSLAIAPAYMAYIMAVRFLTDYLAGDVYYHTIHQSHNLDRARAQLRLCQQLLRRQSDMKEILSF